MKTFIRNSKSAFSLVEVVVAIGIFSLAIVGVIGLLSPTTKAVTDVADSDSASRVVSMLQSLASTSAGWSDFTTGSNAMLRLSSDVATYDGTLNPNYSSLSYVYFASKDGGIVGNYDSAKWGGAAESQLKKDAKKFFEVVLIRNWNPTASPASGLSDPANDNTAGYLAYTIRLRWPAYLPDGTRISDHTLQRVLIVPAAVTR
jgi:type II secretory pathway pseudopilin PulG